MSPTSTWLEAIARWRIDAAAVVLATMLGCYVTHLWVRRHGASAEFSRLACLAVNALAVVGALLAEWSVLLVNPRVDGGSLPVALARGTVLCAVALVALVILVAAARLAVLRREVRHHAAIEAELQRAKIAADEASRAKGDFLAVVSHEIRTPLNAVMGFANLLSGTRLDDAQRGYVATITSEGARLTSLVSDILDLTKMEGGRLLLERLPFAPAETAHDVLKLMSARAQEKNIELRFEAQLAGPLLIAGDPFRFRQILVNLVDNAIKFTPRGSVTVYLQWIAPPSPGQTGELLVRVRDTGIGIPPDRLSGLFQMFVQVDSSTTRRFGGTGLGLAICRRLVELMGGRISAQSEPGAGSEFQLSIPFALVAPPELSPAENEPAAPVQPPRILVVDDMETNRFLLEVFLRRSGFAPELAAGGEEAIRLAGENAYDAILMDLQMPDLDGFTATERIRAAEPEGRHTPIIALTATITDGTRERCLASGMDEHLTKPLDLRKFRLLLQRFIPSRSALVPPRPDARELPLLAPTQG